MTKPTWNGNEGHPLTDLAENNLRIRNQTRAIMFIGGGFLLLAVYVLFQIMNHDLFTVYVNSCLGG